MNNRIENKEELKKLWTDIYNIDGNPDWSHILPYYDENIYFCDTVQKIQGIKEFKAMTERLSKRSENLKMTIINMIKEDNLFLIEWEMQLSFKKYPSSILHGASRLTLNPEGKIIIQRDYYDLWGDIFDNIPVFAKRYRKFMKKKFG